MGGVDKGFSRGYITSPCVKKKTFLSKFVLKILWLSLPYPIYAQFKKIINTPLSSYEIIYKNQWKDKQKNLKNIVLC